MTRVDLSAGADPVVAIGDAIMWSIAKLVEAPAR
jgi:hypothetical protein